MSILHNPYTGVHTDPAIKDSNEILRRVLASDLDDATKIKVINLIVGADVSNLPPATGGPVPRTTQPWTITYNVSTAQSTPEEIIKKANAYKQQRMFDYDATGKLVDGVQQRGDNPNNDNDGQGTYKNGVYTA